MSNFHGGTVVGARTMITFFTHPQSRQSAGSCGPAMAMSRANPKAKADHAALFHSVQARHCDHADEHIAVSRRGWQHWLLWICG